MPTPVKYQHNLLRAFEFLSALGLKSVPSIMTSLISRTRYLNVENTKVVRWRRNSISILTQWVTLLVSPAMNRLCTRFPQSQEWTYDVSRTSRRATYAGVSSKWSCCIVSSCAVFSLLFRRGTPMLSFMLKSQSKSTLSLYSMVSNTRRWGCRNHYINIRIYGG